MSDVHGSLVAEGVALAELRRPPHNFFDEEMLTDLADLLSSYDEDPDVACVVVASEGRHFCAGADLRGMDAAGIRRVYRQGERIVAGGTPIVAAVHGSAVGGGLGLAMVADFRTVAPDARLTANFAKLGFHQGFGLSVTLPRTVGQQRALDLLYTGRDIDGRSAVEMGLCDRAAEDPRAEALGWASEIADSAPLSVPAIRTTMRRSLVESFAAAVEIEAAAQARLLDTDDFHEGVAAAVERREPVFSGR